MTPSGKTRKFLVREAVLAAPTTSSPTFGIVGPSWSPAGAIRFEVLEQVGIVGGRQP
jgi:hypothetical protein